MNATGTLRAGLACAIAVLITGFATMQAAAQGPAAMNSLTQAERDAGWQLLFDGQTLDGWRGYQSDSLPRGWHVEDGEIRKEIGTRDIITKQQFGDFELEMDWKLDPGGNSGLFYRATEEYNHIYWSAPEYALLDDSLAADGRRRITSAGAAHSVMAPPAGVVKPGGEWNHTRLVVNGAHVEHWLNGQKLFEYELWSPEWKEKVAASKFGRWPNYGLAKEGYIGIQGDHNGALALRNIRIREL